MTPSPTSTPKHHPVEESFRQSEECFRLLVESVVDYALYMLDPDGNVATWNVGAQKIKGYTADEIIGRNYSTFFTEEAIREGRPLRQLEIARAVGRYEGEGWRVRKDGSRFWSNVVLTAIHTKDGTLAGFAKVTRDLTAVRSAEEGALRLAREQAARAAAEQAELELRDEHARYRALSRRLEGILEGVADGITVQDRAGRLLFANTAAARMCGVNSVGELLSMPAASAVARFELLDEEGQPFPPSQLPGRRVLAGEKSASALVRVRNPDTQKWCWSFIRATGVGQNGNEAAVNVWRDVTAERRREEHERLLGRATGALASSLDYETMLTELASALVPAISDWCSVHVLEGEELSTVAVIHSDPSKTASARKFLRKYPPDPSLDSGVWQVVRSGTSVLRETLSDAALVHAARDEEHLRALRTAGMTSLAIVPIVVRGRVLGAITAVHAESGRSFDDGDVALLEEIGRRAGNAIENIRLYQAAQRAAREAEEASRAKDEFLATVSHELRTPLNAMIGWSSILRTRVVDPALKKGIESIHRNAVAQSKLIEDILDVSRIITGKLRLELRTVNLATLVRDAMEVVRPSATAKNISLRLVGPSREPAVVADPERLQQVFWNLLSNAVKFTNRNGQITVSVAQDGAHCTVSVEDDGIGIRRDFLPHVFERFKQADGSTTRGVGGLGLGLAIVRHIMELHGGEVHAESLGPGLGSRFTVSLPIPAVNPADLENQPADPRFRKAAPVPSALASLRGLRVLVVDDHVDARELLQTLIADAGAEVDTAGSAADGLAALDRLRPHVLVSDIGMPGQDGYTFMRTVRASSHGRHVPAIALTAYTRAEDRARALEAGFNAHIGKPVDPARLIGAIARLAG